MNTSLAHARNTLLGLALHGGQVGRERRKVVVGVGGGKDRRVQWRRRRTRYHRAEVGARRQVRRTGVGAGAVDPGLAAPAPAPARAPPSAHRAGQRDQQRRPTLLRGLGRGRRGRRMQEHHPAGAGRVGVLGAVGDAPAHGVEEPQRAAAAAAAASDLRRAPGARVGVHHAESAVVVGGEVQAERDERRVGPRGQTQDDEATSHSQFQDG